MKLLTGIFSGDLACFHGLLHLSGRLSKLLQLLLKLGLLSPLPKDLVDDDTPAQTTFVRGICAGVVNLGLAFAFESVSLEWTTIGLAFLGYGVSLILYLQGGHSVSSFVLDRPGSWSIDPLDGASRSGPRLSITS
jgi:hypothetical protein